MQIWIPSERIPWAQYKSMLPITDFVYKITAAFITVNLTRQTSTTTRSILYAVLFVVQAFITLERVRKFRYFSPQVQIFAETAEVLKLSLLFAGAASLLMGATDLLLLITMLVFVLLKICFRPLKKGKKRQLLQKFIQQKQLKVWENVLLVHMLSSFLTNSQAFLDSLVCAHMVECEIDECPCRSSLFPPPARLAKLRSVASEEEFVEEKKELKRRLSRISSDIQDFDEGERDGRLEVDASRKSLMDLLQK